MANQSIKQEIYNSMIQKAFAEKRNEELVALNNDFAAFQEQQKNPDALMADFNSFMQSQQPKTQTVQTQKIPSLSDHQKLVNKAVEERTRLAALDKKKAEEQKTKEENRAIVSGISQRLQDSIIPQKKEEPKKTEQPKIVAQPTQTNDVDKWLSPDYKLTDEDKKAAKEYAQAELQKLNYDSNKKPILKSAEDRQHYSDMVNLLNKSNTLTNAMTGVIKQPAALGRAVRDAGRSLTNQITGLGAALGDKLGITEGATQRHNENIADRDAFYRQNDESMQRALEGAHTQSPRATGAGEFGGQLAMYALTNPMFDALGAAAGLGKAGSFALNQVGQNAQDLALDTIPMLNNYLEGGVNDEERKELLKNVGINAAGNLALGAAGEGISALAKNRAAKKAADAAFQDNAMEGADKLAKLAGTEDIDNIVRSATRQTEEAAQNIEDISKQIPKVPEEPKNYIPSMEELRELEREASVMDEAEDLSNIWKSDVDTKGLRPHATNQGVSPSIENAAEELSKQMDAPKYSVDNGVDNPNLTREANDAINSYLFQLEDPFNNPKVDDAVGGLISKVTSDNGFKLMDDYNELSRQLRESVEDNPAIREQLAELRKGINSVDKAEREAVKDLLDYADIQNAIADYKKALNGMDEEAIDKAAKSLDAARNRVARRNNADATLKEAFGGSYGPIINRPKNAFELKPDEAVVDDIVDDWVKQDIENPNRFVSSAESDTKVKEHLGGKVVAEDTGLVPDPEGNKLTFDYEKPVGDTVPEYKITEEVDTPDNLKERGQSKHIRNDGTPMKMEGVSEEVAADFEKDPDMYRVLRNADTKARAEEIYNTSKDPESAFRALLEKKDPAALPLGHQLAKDYSANGNHDAAAQIYRDMGKALTESGQFSQAAIINMVKNDPMTALQFAQKEIDALNDAGVKRFGDKWKNFKLSEDEIKAFENVKAGDTDAIKAIYEQIGDRLGKDYPTTMWEKLIEARRVAMLFNPRTNVRNVLANPPTLGMRWLSDRTEALGQNIAHLINPDIKVTQSLYGSGRRGRQLAKEALNSPRVKALFEGSGSKADLPNLKNTLMDNKQVFKGTAAEKWIDKVTNGGIQKANEVLFGKKGVQSVPETIRNATYKLLDLGDRPFVKENFVERLGSYIAATGAKSLDDIPDEAIDMAWEEAMKATYKDNSWAVDMIRGLKKSMEKADNLIPGFGTALSQSTIPFVQAPGNIAARMVDYSPVGAGKGIAHIISGAKKGNVKSIEKGIEEAAKGLTGSGLIYLGMKLKESGLLTGTYSKDKDQKAFEKMNGFKEFALHVGDNYFTYGWAQPFAQELMVGTLLQDAIDKSDEYDSDILRYYGLEGSTAGKALGVAREGTKAAINSWFNESPLSGFADILKGNSYEKTDIAGNLWENGVSDFAGALIPSVVNATAKVVDTTQRNTYNPDNTYASFINANIAKIPGLSKTLPAKYDTWGQEMKYAENAGAAAAARYAIPGEYSYDKDDDIDNEINRLFNEGVDSEGKPLQDNGVFPLVAPNKVGDKTLNNREVSEYQKDMGQRSRKAVEAFINSDAYKDIPDAEKVEILKNIYGSSSAITKRDKFDTPVPDNSSYKKAIAAYDEAGGGEKGAKAIADFYMQKKVADESGLSSQSKAYEEIQKDLQAGKTEAAQEKVDAATTLKDLGLTKPGPTYGYYKAQEVIPNLTVEDFAKTYKAIDKDGNQSLKKKDEIIPYMNSQNMNYSEGMKFWKAYANKDWKLPKLEGSTWK